MMQRLGLLETDELRLPLAPIDEPRRRIPDEVLGRARLLQAALA